MGLFEKLFGKKKNKSEPEPPSRPQIPEEVKQNLKYISQTELSVDTITRQFVHTDKRSWCTVGMVDFPTGKVIVADPFYYLYE